MSLLELAVLSFVISISGAFAPGPLTVLAVSEATRHGWRSGPLVTTGHTVVELILVLGLSFGLGQLAEVKGVRGAISLVGGAVLLYMGLMQLRAAAVGRTQIELSGLPASRSPGSSRAIAVSGALVTMANPYWLFWWATVGLKLIATSLQTGVLGPPAFFVGHIAADFVWLTCVASVVSSLRRGLHRTLFVSILVGCAFALTLLGAVFVATGLREFL